MNSILDQIIENKRKEVSQLKTRIRYQDFENMAFFNTPCRSIKNVLQEKSFGIIAEYKRKSPSAGIINNRLTLSEIANLYEQNEMAAISILTDQAYFGGSNEDVIMVRKNNTIPILRKEFIVDEIQLFESKAIGSDAILLIAEVLSKQEINQFTTIAKSIGLEVILELHEPIMIDKIDPQVDLIGVNNRNLKRQQTVLQTSFNLLPYLPANILKISESGIRSKSELIALKNAGFSGALIGESILKNDEKRALISQFKSVNHVA